MHANGKHVHQMGTEAVLFCHSQLSQLGALKVQSTEKLRSDLATKHPPCLKDGFEMFGTC